MHTNLNSFSLLSFLLIFLHHYPLYSQHGGDVIPSTRVEATIDLSKPGPKIDRLLYGHFIENLSNWFEGGLWAKMLGDRKFFYPVNNREALNPPNSRDWILGRWRPVGPESYISLATKSSYIGEHSPRIQVDANNRRGIQQAGLSLVKGKSYEGRVILAATTSLAGTPGSTVEVSLVWGEGVNARQTITIDTLSSEYEKYYFSFTSQTDTKEGSIEITGTGTGSFLIGAVSLMPTDNIEGFRSDLLELLRQMNVTMFRWGGNFSAGYEWRDGIGDRDKRPPRYDYAWNSVEQNDVGTFEFLTLCRLVGAEPNIGVNAGLGDAYSAAQWVEYVNGSTDTPMDKLRAEKPHTITSSLLQFLCIAFFISCNSAEEKTEMAGKHEPVVQTLYATPGHAPTVGAMYPRVLKIQHHAGSEGNLLATFEHYMHREPSFPIYRSTDRGETWHLYSEVEDTKNEWGMRYQPHLFELPQQVGEFPAGTIFCSGNSIPDDRSATELLVFFSTDGGKSWEFLSSIIKGGRAIYPNTGETPVWEPFLGLDSSGRLVAYYSDERYYDDGYDQLLAHKVSEDGGRTWGEEVFDVAVPDGKTRPGMAVVTRLPNGRYMMVFEIVGVEGIPVHYKLSDDGLDWGDPADLGKRIMNKEGHFLKSTPYVVWTPYGGENGSVIVSGMGTNIDGELTGNGYMINRHLGEGEWTHIEAPITYNTDGPGGYSQTMIPMDENGQEILQLVPVPNGNERHMDIQYAKFNLP